MAPIYNAAAIGNPADREPDRWYARPYPVPVPLGEVVGDPYETAGEAERAVRARHARGAKASQAG